MMFNDEILCQSFSRPGGTYAGADADPAFKRRAIAGLSRWDEKSRTTKLRPACQMAVRKERNMPLLTELENVLECGFYNDSAPDGAGGWRDFIWTKFLRGSNFKL